MTADTRTLPARSRIAVVGGGWAGCAAAVELASRGHLVSLFERARTLGGRARAVELNGRRLDNGQHILLGAYTQTLRLMRMIGMQENAAFLRLPLQMRYPPGEDGMDFVAPRLPAPWHLLTALFRSAGLRREDKLALVRFTTTARWMDWQLDQDCPVTELLLRFDQTERLIRLMWRPLCIAALNTMPDQASAKVFLNVMRDSLGARRTASDMLLPTLDLSTLFPDSAAAFITQAGGQVHTGTAICDIEATGSGWKLQCTRGAMETAEAFDAVIIATPAEQAVSLLATTGDAVALPVFEYEPIITCYLQYAPDVRLPVPFYALLDNAPANKWGQFVFDRGYLAKEQAGLLAVVISAANEALQLSHPALVAQVALQLAQALQLPALAQPVWHSVIAEKRATFSCTPGLQRPAACTRHQNLVLAGDYIESDYPATLESAIRSGIQAATILAG